MNEIMNGIKERRSCKAYRSDPVPNDLIEQIIEAGLYAASAMGKQSPIIVAVSDKETRDKISRLNSKYDVRKRPDPFYGAPVVLTVLVGRDVGTGTCDGSLVLGNMLLAAHALKVGSCWIHRAEEVFNDDEGKAILASLGVEGDYVGIGHCILGYPAAELPEAAPRKEGRVFYSGK